MQEVCILSLLLCLHGNLSPGQSYHVSIAKYNLLFKDRFQGSNHPGKRDIKGAAFAHIH